MKAASSAVASSVGGTTRSTVGGDRREQGEPGDRQQQAADRAVRSTGAVSQLTLA